MISSTDVLSLLARTAFIAGRAAVRRHGLAENTMRCSVSLRLFDGSFGRFALQIEDVGGSLTVRECAARRLPWSCFERHLLREGYFCLGRDESWLYPRTVADARTWWRMVRGYLYCQLDAELLGVWTAPTSWAHGAGAGAQQLLERLELQRPGLVGAVRAEFENRCVESQPVCLFDARRAAAQTTVVRDLRSLIASKQPLEERFWANQPVELRCCNTMKHCGLVREVA